MRIAITGATGFIGQALVLALARQGHSLRLLSRDPQIASHLPGQKVTWNPDSPDPSLLRDCEALIHLAGEPIAQTRWSSTVKGRIRRSRIQSTRHWIELLAQVAPQDRPKTFICGSAIGYYGSRSDESLNESSKPGAGFLAEVVQEWETEASRAEALGMRTVHLRTGIVLGHGGGALQKMQPVILGSGQQWMSWIHLEDAVRLIVLALEDPSVRGPLNLVAPHPVRNADFTRQFAALRHTPFVVSTPALVLRAAMGEMSAIVLDSAKVLPLQAQAHGFEFTFPELKGALESLYPKDPLVKVFISSQYIARPIQEVFQFFSQAENLELITPPWLKFKILNQSTANIREGTLIDYRLTIRGVPQHWRTQIENWDPPRQFVDLQLKGPYSHWHHTHRFESLDSGTLISDEVQYKLPGGALGSLLGARMIHGEVSQIFEYRKKAIAERFQ